MKKKKNSERKFKQRQSWVLQKLKVIPPKGRDMYFVCWSCFGGCPLFFLQLPLMSTEMHEGILLCFSFAHRSVWLPSLLCHFKFSSHLFHGLIGPSDDRRMRWRERGRRERVKDKGLCIVQPLQEDGEITPGIPNIYFKHCAH